MKRIVVFPLIAILATFAYSQNPQSEFIKIADDGWNFETATSRTSFVPFGANYYDPASWDTSVVWDNPQFIAPNVIGKFDSVRTRRHFAQLQQIGINIIRIFLSVKRFEPALFQLDETSFHKVDKIIELAKEHNLRIIFDLVEVWEGAPDWMSWEYYADEATLQGLEFLVSAFGQRYASEPNIFAWDLINEPHVRWSDAHMDQLWIEWVHVKYLTLDSLRAAWDDYPRPSETWRNIKVPEEFINKFRDQRLFDFQLFREDVAHKWTERLVKAIRKKDPNHLITVGLIQWSAPIKKSGDHPGSYPAFNPHKIAPLVDYISIHGYNWWDENVGTYIRGLLRFCYTNKPVLLEEFEYRSVTIDETWNSASGWLAWACYQGPFDPNPEAFLFDFNENLTNSGRAFQQKALSSKGQIPSRIADAARIDADLKDLVTSADRPDSLYARYVETQKNLSSPLGFNILNLKPPIISSDTSGNLLRNPSFEQFNDPSGVADYWEFSPGLHTVVPTFSIDARDGQHAQRIDIQLVGVDTYATLFQPQSVVRLRGGADYKFSFWTKGRGKIVPSIILNGFGYVKWGEIITLTDSWQNVHVTFTTPDVVTSIEELIRFADSGNFGTVQAGDWVLIDGAVLSVLPVNLAPMLFSLLSPTNGDTLTILAPSFTWHQAIDPNPGDQVVYALQIDRNQNFSAPITFSNIMDTTYTLKENLTAETTYYWKVIASDTSGLQTLSDEIFMFTIFPLTTVEETVQLPTYFDMAQNYPNPFNPTTKINYSLPQASQVTIKVFNILGQEVKTIINEYQNAGRYIVNIDFGNFASGIYIYQMRAGEFINAKKFALIK